MSFSADTDRQLLAACRAGEQQAFGSFYVRHREVLLSFLVRRVRNPEVAADLLAETFASALVAIKDQDRPVPDVPAAWLFTIARNLMVDAVGRQRVEGEARRKLGLERLQLDDQDIRSIEAVASSTDVVAELEKRIPAAEWQVFCARVLDDESYGHIASRLRCSEAVVRKRVSRAKSNLRTILGGRSV
ncbi:MAG TPA: RNA polymerase sigma factor [Solirubrobacteraceae bacterium]